MKLLLILFLASLTCGSTKYDHYLLNCGALGNTSVAWDDRNWFSDQNPTFADDFSSTVSAKTTTTSNLFSRARIFISNFTYRFPVSPGPKFIRLFFYPSDYSTPTGFISTTDAYVTVHVNSGDQHLLRNFSAYHSAITTSLYHIKKEFYVHINVSILQLTFFPSSPTSYAFINGIEVVSVPNNLYVRPGSLPRYVSQPEAKFVLSLTPLETAYRVNVGGNDYISSSEDSGSMYRQWVNDDSYLIGNFNGTANIAITAIKYSPETLPSSYPNDVYESFRSMGMVTNDVRFRVNLTWGFEVDLGFYYLVRLHWCEVAAYMTAVNFRVFDVYIAEQMADQAVDIFGLVGGYTPVFKDYVVYMNDGDDTTTSRGLLKLAMHPNPESKPKYYDVLLNGLEIFKLNNLNYAQAAHQVHPNGSQDNATNFHVHLFAAKRKKLIIGGAISGTVVLGSLVAFAFVFRRMSATNDTKNSAMSTDDVCHQFSLAQLKLATNDFNEELIIGHGGFGNVYKAVLNGEKFAIKRLNPSSKQGAHEFKTEIEMLSKIRHFHLVSLIGYCNESGEMILVYDYMEHGTLRDHLYNTTEVPLSWNLRLSICLGAAKGLHYLHAGVGQMIIHRDVKSTNILLDENWVPKVSDFGLSKLGPIGGDLHVSTAVKGSFGYMDPEYYMLQRLTEKSDVYSFGVVLFEVLCGRAAVDPTLPWEQVSLAMWARGFQQRGEIEEIVDPNIKDEVASACLRRFGEIAERCVREHRTQRPTMADVVCSLESALKLQRQSDLLSNGNIVDDNGVPILVSQSTSFSELQLSLSSSTVVSNSYIRGSPAK